MLPPIFDRIRRNEQKTAEFHEEEEKLEEKDVKYLSSLLSVNTSLITLRLFDKSFYPKYLNYIVNAVKMNKTLRTFEIIELAILDINIIVDLINNNKTLTELRLEDTAINRFTFALIANALVRNTTLSHISFLGNQIGDAGARMIAGVLKRNRTLVSIGLSSCNITDVGWREIARTIVLTNSNVRILVDVGVDFNLIKETVKTEIKQINFDAAYSQTVLELRRNKFDDDRIRYVMEMVLRTWNDDTWLFDPAERAAAAQPEQKRLCKGCLIGTPQFYEEGDPKRRFCSSYCQIIYHFH
jgi:hypothetical protein